ncbi:hypothetical protein [Rubinisphaera brasiliensis]|uniref:HEAT repeat domain-containing protein n=1 Tax=Rubinisphaera brasiliensis (strain ATCC 49424 / DSM 5305 / JCM 21570 / IAM 15109 / NBRC 103401 / IFAM 1448) TaxID=756272 RepID=F0SGA1_RUBBR|nr:hypothetical protein [Rubinisphaera brasiliensis]ADY59443.1 hypothetical protein Plabr_1833 [Rubinisphaera brasiliensis DSM 5305]
MIRQLFLILCIMRSTAVAYAEEPNAAETLDPEALIKRSYAVKKERKEVIAALIEAVEQDERELVHYWHEPTTMYMIWRLGNLKAEEAIPLLILRLTYLPHAQEHSLGKLRTYDYYPAASSLVDIGYPAAKAVVSVISNTKSTDEEVEIAAWVILCALAQNQFDPQERDRGRAVAFLKEWIRIRGDEEVRDNYYRAVHFIWDHEPSLEPPARVKKLVEIREKYSKPLPETPYNGGGFF